MAMTVRHVRPTVDPRIAVRAAGELGVEAAGKVLLSASQSLVPVDTGALKASGKSEKIAPNIVRVSYDAVAPDGYFYGIRQHEDATLHHPNGGEDHFLSKPCETEAPAMLATIAEAVRVVL